MPTRRALTLRAAAAFYRSSSALRTASRGDHEFREMGRPSFIRLAVTMKHRQVVSAAISGEAIVVTECTHA
jgi:hypothetical protein